MAKKKAKKPTPLARAGSHDVQGESQCSICQCPDEDRRNTADQMLIMRVSRYKIEAQTGFPRTNLGRHRKHIWNRLERAARLEAIAKVNKWGRDYQTHYVRQLAMLEKVRAGIVDGTVKMPVAQIRAIEALGKATERMQKSVGDFGRALNPPDPEIDYTKMPLDQLRREVDLATRHLRKRELAEGVITVDVEE